MKNNVGEFTLIDFNTYYKTTVIKCYVGERKDT